MGLVSWDCPFKRDLLIDTTFRQIFLAGQSLEVKDRGFMHSTFQDGGSKFQDGGSTVQSVGLVDISMLLQGPVQNSVMYCMVDVAGPNSRADGIF